MSEFAKLPKRSWWSTNLGIATLVIGAVLLAGSALFVFRSSFRLFSIPADSMEPLLKVGDRITADMWSKEPVERGDVVMVAAKRSPYIKRIVGLPGDRIALVDGVPTINGTALIQNLVRTDTAKEYGRDRRPMRIFKEVLPDGKVSYLVADLGPSPYDTFAEVTVPAGHYFLLGDNRDYSVDSRISEAQMGLGMVEQYRIYGKARSIVWRTGAGLVSLPIQPDTASGS